MADEAAECSAASTVSADDCGVEITLVSMLVRGCVFVGLFHAPFSAVLEVLAMSLGRICVRGRRSLVNALKIMSDIAFSIKNHVVFDVPSNTDRQKIISVQKVCLEGSKKVVICFNS